MGDPEVDDYDDPTEALRIAVIVLGLALNVAVIYWEMKDTAPMIEARAKLGAWWDRTFLAPRRARRAIQRAENEVVFEAMQVVEGGAA